MYGYIYKTTNLVNGKIYIGQHKASAFNSNTYKGSGIYLLAAIREFGKCNFKCEMLEECNSKKMLDEREKYWIDFYKSRDPNIGYNRAEGGVGKLYFTGCQHSDSEKARISESSKDRIFINKKNVNKYVKKKNLDMYLANGWVIGRIKRSLSTEELKVVGKKISDSKKGNKYYTDGKKIILIKPADIDYYESLGYYPGQSLHEWYWMNFNHVDYKVPRDKYLHYKSIGYVFGRITKGRCLEERAKSRTRFLKIISKPRSEESKRKFREKRLGHCVSIETRNKISKSLKEKNKTLAGKNRLKKAAEKGLQTRLQNNSLKHSEETKQKISKARILNNGMRGKHPEKICVIKDNCRKTISKKNLENYLNCGYQIYNKQKRGD